MSASYPTSVKAFTDIVDTTMYPQATQMNQAYDEIEAIETELGVNPAGNYDTVVLRLNEHDNRSPTGSIIMWPTDTAPTGWLLCRGQSLLKADYTSTNPLGLYNVIGTLYGSADGTHFSLPDLQGRVPVGLKSTETEFDALGETGGSRTASAELVTHTHTGPAHTHTGPSHTHGVYYRIVSYGVGSGTVTPCNVETSDGTFTSEAAGTGNTGSSGTGATGAPNVGTDTSHANLQPYIVLNYIIKT